MGTGEVIALIAAIISGAGVVATIVIFVVSNRITNKKIFVEAFDKIYNRVFSLKKDIENSLSIEFHFELDEILTNKSIENKVLEHLTSIENISMLIIDKTNIYKKLFDKTASIALYKRMLCLTPYIFYKQKEQSNHQLFSNYLSLIELIEKSKVSNNNSLKVYSGIRCSDVEYDSLYFSNRVCLFDSKEKQSYTDYRANQNYNCSDFTNFFAKSFDYISQKYKDIDYEIVFYNQKNVFELAPKIRKHAAYYNEERLLTALNDKILMKDIIKKANVDVPNYSIINGAQICSKNISALFNSSKVIIQTTHGGGGIGTYLFDVSDVDNHLEEFAPMRRFIVSEYIEKSISVNVHIIITKTCNTITPGSVQIIEKIDNQLNYRGADFIVFRDISISTREKIRKLSVKICNALRNEGYRGVAGIDYIIDENDQVYCLEINPRFQSSTVIISKYLQESNSFFKDSLVTSDTSVFDINSHAFEDVVKNSISFYDEINYSCYFYYNDAEQTLENIKKRIDILKNFKPNANTKKKKIISIHTDGLENFDGSLINARSYLFRCIYGNKITEISNDHKLWVNNNIKLENPPKTDLELKISLVNQGVRIVDNIDFKEAVFSGIDFYIPSKDLYINAPLNVGLSSYSPYEIKKNDTSYALYYYNTLLCLIEIEQDYSNIFKSSSNSKLKDILYISSDRIRIKPINGCDFKSNDEGCKFCELGFSKEHYSLNDIESAIIASKKLDFKHILIGGGTDLSKESWSNIERIIKLIKMYYPNKNISLMSIPIPAERLSVLKELGVSDVVFNIEIYDEKTAFEYMPGKRNYNFDLYYNTLKEAVTVFGCGNVRSTFIVGLESTDSLLEGVMKICGIGVLPCLSIYRCTNHSLNKLNPTNEYLNDVYNRVLEITKAKGLEIGPKCRACQNNMLVI